MIPTIEDIVDGLLAGRYSREQAIEWLRLHEDEPPNQSREYAAMLIMAGYVSHPNIEKLTFAEVASDAVNAADALLAELDRTKES